MSLEKKLDEILRNSLLLPDRAVKTAIDGIAELTTKAGMDRYRLSQAVIMSGGLMAGVSAAGYWLSEPQNLLLSQLEAFEAAADLTILPFMAIRIKRYLLNSEDAKSFSTELYLKLTRAARFPLLFGSTLSLIGFYELSNIGIPLAAGIWGVFAGSLYAYLIDGKTNRWDKAKEWYRKFGENFSVRKTQALPRTDAFVTRAHYGQG